MSLKNILFFFLVNDLKLRRNRLEDEMNPTKQLRERMKRRQTREKLRIAWSCVEEVENISYSFVELPNYQPCSKGLVELGKDYDDYDDNDDDCDDDDDDDDNEDYDDCGGAVDEDDDDDDDANT